MFLSNELRYAVNAMVEIVTHARDDTPIKISEISEKQNIPTRYLEQICMKLKNAGLILSIRGPNGGYIINGKIELITVGNVIEAIGENVKMTQCSTKQKCRQDGLKCLTHDLWKGLTKHIMSYFYSVHIIDIVNGKFNLTSQNTVS